MNVILQKDLTCGASRSTELIKRRHPHEQGVRVAPAAHGCASVLLFMILKMVLARVRSSERSDDQLGSQM